MLVPGVKRSSLLQALSTVSCTRSSAVAGLREAQREGTQFGHQRDEFVPRRGGGRGLSHEVDPVPSGASADHADGPADHRRARHGIAGADSRRSVFRSRAAHLLGRRDRLRPAGRVVASETSLSWRRSAHGGLQPNAGGRLRFPSIAGRGSRAKMGPQAPFGHDPGRRVFEGRGTPSGSRRHLSVPARARGRQPMSR